MSDIPKLVKGALDEEGGLNNINWINPLQVRVLLSEHLLNDFMAELVDAMDLEIHWSVMIVWVRV